MTFVPALNPLPKKVSKQASKKKPPLSLSSSQLGPSKEETKKKEKRLRSLTSSSPNSSSSSSAVTSCYLSSYIFVWEKMLMVEKRKRQSKRQSHCFSIQVSFSLHLLFFWFCLMAKNLSTVFANGILSRLCLSPPPPLRLLLQWYALLFFFFFLLVLVNDWSDANSLLQFWIWIWILKEKSIRENGLVLFADVG